MTLLVMMLTLQGQVPTIQAPNPTLSVGRELRQDLPLDQKIQALQAAGRWAELADLFETLEPKARGQRLGIWLEAMKKAQRWERLLAVLDAAIPQMEAKGAKALSERLLRVTALDRLGRKEDAFEAGLEVGLQGSSWCVIMAGNLAATVGRDDWLERAADSLIALYPKEAQGWAWKGECLFRAGKYGAAEAPLEKAVELQPKLAGAWCNLGACRNIRKAYPEAIQACDKALALDPLFLQAHFNRGLAHFGLQKYTEGREDMAKALATDPKDPETRARIEENLKLADRYLASRTRKGASGSK